MVKYSQKSVIGKIRHEIARHGLISSGDTIIVALSGGADSICLLDILDKLKVNLNIRLMACHFNHKLRGEESNADQHFVEQVCLERGIKCIVGSVSFTPKSMSEEQARDARYAFFKKILIQNRGSKVAIAHNANDVAETFLLRLIRGTGLRGLKSIPSYRDDYIRPLLSVTRPEIESYLKEEGIEYRVDATNSDTRYTRNFIREIILPQMKKINPNIIETLTSSTRTIDADYDLINSLADRAYRSVLVKENKQKIILEKSRWIKLHPSIQRSVLRKAVYNLSSLIDVTNRQLSDVIELLNKGQGNKYHPLPHSLRIELKGGKIIIEKEDIEAEQS